jgi:trigger factor
MDEELTSGGGKDKNFTVTVEITSSCKRTLVIDVTDEALQAEKVRLVEKLRMELEVPGFRKGKVPASYIEKNYAGHVHTDAVQNLLTRAYQETLIREHLHPLGEPRFEDIEAEDGKGLSVKAHIEVKPEVEISGYRDVSFEVQKKDIGDEQVDDTLAKIRESMTTYQVVDRAAEQDDYLVIDFAPYLESGELDENARQTNYGVALEGESLLPEFRQGLMGLKAGDEKEILVRYPEEFPDKNLAGQTKSFHVKVSEVKEKLLPELDDAFAKNVSQEVASLDELKERIKEDLQREEDARHQQNVQEQIIDKIIEKNSFEVPDAMVENYLTSILEEDRRRRPQVEDEEVRSKEVHEMFREPALRMVKRYFIMDAVVKQENLQVTEEELEEKFKSLAKEAERDIEEVRNVFKNAKHRMDLENEILDQKVLNFLRENADIKVA